MIYWLVFFHMVKFRLCCCWWSCKIRVCWQEAVNLSFLNFLLLRHHKLQGHVYVACEQIKCNGKTCIFAGHWFSDKTFSADGNKFAADFWSFCFIDSRKNHQISRSGPWSATYHCGLMTFRKNKWNLLIDKRNVLKIFLIHIYKFSFLRISNTYRVFLPHWIYSLHSDFS